MQTITHMPENDTYVYRSGRYSDVREVSPIFTAAYHLSKSYPEMTSRLWKAAVIFTDGLVDLIPPEGQAVHTYDFFTATDTAVVSSKATDAGYMVRRLHWRTDLAPGEPVPNHSHKFSCECFDYMEGKAPIIKGQPQCKHIMATRIALKQRDDEQALTQLQTVTITETEAVEADLEGARILAAAKDKARRRYKGNLLERVNDHIEKGRWQMQQAQS